MYMHNISLSIYIYICTCMYTHIIISSMIIIDTLSLGGDERRLLGSRGCSVIIMYVFSVVCIIMYYVVICYYYHYHYHHYYYLTGFSRAGCSAALPTTSYCIIVYHIMSMLYCLYKSYHTML